MKPILIAAHRGQRGGNLVENTLPAFEAALRMGADILETDLKRTADGALVLYHDLDVSRLLPLHGPARAYTLRELRAFDLKNGIGENSGCRIATLEELFALAKGRCLINLDQSEPFIEEAWALARRAGVEGQLLFKGAPPFADTLAALRRCGPDVPFIPVLRSEADLAAFRALPAGLRVPMAELIFRREDAPVFAPAFRRELAERGIRVWVNALDLGAGLDMSALHNDTVSMTGGPAQGWGWLIRQGVSVIQTDFPLALRAYLRREGNA